MSFAIESLEDRVLFSGGPRVTNVIADNRGLALIYFDQQVDQSTVTTSSVQMFTAGPDGQLGTSDDRVVSGETVKWAAGRQRIVLNGNLAADTSYWVIVRSSTVKGVNAQPVDGTFSGTFPSGNGGAGSDFIFEAVVSPVNKIATFTVNGFNYNVQLYNDPRLWISVPNFLYYANNGLYDNTFIHRITTSAADGFGVIQGGAFFVSADPVLSAHQPVASIAAEPTFNNDAGTLAFANTGAANSTGNQWYFNTTDNQSAFGANYTVIGKVTNSLGTTAINTIDSYRRLDLTTTISNGTSRFGSQNIVQQLNQVPVLDSSVTANNVDPATQFVIVTRIAVRNTVAPLGIVAVGPTIALPSAIVTPFVPSTSAVFSSTAITPTPGNGSLDLTSKTQSLLA